MAGRVRARASRWPFGGAETVTVIAPRDVGVSPGPIGVAINHGRQALRSRVFWFVMERYSSLGFGFLLTAALARGTPLDRLAEYLAAFALISVFEPLFAGSVSGYLLKLIRSADSPAAAALTFRTTFWMMQAVAAVFVAGACALFLALPGDHLITALFFLQIFFTPWKLFSAPLIARDQFMRVTPVQVCANFIGGSMRVGVALATHNLLLIPVLMCIEPIISTPIIKARTGIKLFERPPLSKDVALVITRQLPSLMGVMVLVCLFYRSPVMLARLDLGAAAVVRVALALQVVSALSVIQNALSDSLIGPLAHALDADSRFMKLLSIGSAALVLYGLGVWVLLWLAGEPLLTVVFGKRAEMVGPIIAALAPLCLVSGLARLSNSVINLRARPSMMVIVWSGALAGQVLAGVLLAHWRSPLVIALMTPLSLLGGLALALLFGGARGYVAEVLFGFRRIILAPSQWPDALAVMVGGKNETARHSS